MDRGQSTDPNSPLYSVMPFEALDLQPNLLKGLKAMGYVTPSRIQEVALPTLLLHPPRNMIAQSPSGTGKTATFVLAMLSRVDVSRQYPQVWQQLQKNLTIYFCTCRFYVLPQPMSSPCR